MKTLYEQLTEMVKKYHQYPNINKVETQTVYQNKEDESDMFTNPDTFIEKGLHGKDYKKVVILNSPKRDFFKEFFGDADFKVTKDVKSDMHIVKLIFAEAGLISPEAINPEQADVPVQQPKKNVVTLKKLNALNAKLQKAKGTDEEQAVRVERVKFYLEEKIEPRNTFKDIELYNIEKAKVPVK